MTTQSKVQSAKSKAIRRRLAFTLIELLVVIAIIAILAAMIIPITSAVKKMKLRTRTQTQLKAVETAIVQYKNKHGFYPPDNPAAVGLNPLFYELSGSTNDGGVGVKHYTTLDRSASIDSTTINTAFGITGFMNSMRDKGGDEGIIAENFLKNGISHDQIVTVYATGPQSGPQVNILVGTVKWPAAQPGALLPNQPVSGADSYNPFRYVSTNPTNNPNGFDLWIDIIIDGKTNRFCNWSEKYLTP